MSGFAPTGIGSVTLQRQQQISSSSQLSLFDKMFEEEGPLGKGITVGKVQVAMMASDRSKDSIFGELKLVPYLS